MQRYTKLTKRWKGCHCTMFDYYHGYVVHKVRATTKIWFLVLRLRAWSNYGWCYLIWSVFFPFRPCIFYLSILTSYRVSTGHRSIYRRLEDYVHRAWYHHNHHRRMGILLSSWYSHGGRIPWGERNCSCSRARQREPNWCWEQKFYDVSSRRTCNRSSNISNDHNYSPSNLPSLIFNDPN